MKIHTSLFVPVIFSCAVFSAERTHLDDPKWWNFAIEKYSVIDQWVDEKKADLAIFRAISKNDLLAVHKLVTDDTLHTRRWLTIQIEGTPQLENTRCVSPLRYAVIRGRKKIALYLFARGAYIHSDSSVHHRWEQSELKTLRDWLNPNVDRNNWLMSDRDKTESIIQDLIKLNLLSDDELENLGVVR